MSFALSFGLVLTVFTASTLGFVCNLGEIPTTCANRFINGDASTTGAPVNTSVVSAVSTSIPDMETYMGISGATYCPGTNDKPLCKWCKKYITNQGFTWFSTVQSDDPANGTLAEIYTNGETAVVAFRGSDNIVNFLQDANFGQEPIVPGSPIKVHSGFKQATNALYTNTLNSLNNLPAGHTTLVITGHSLGGGIALLFACTLTMNDDLPSEYNQVNIYTYGQPRVGNAHFADYVNNNFNMNTRVTSNLDLVPHIPPVYLLGTDLYFHQATEYWTKIFPYTASRSVYEDPWGSNSASPFYVPTDHLQYFDVDITKCFVASFLDTLVPMLVDILADNEISIIFPNTK